MNDPSAEIIFLGIPSDLYGESEGLLKPLYSAGIQKIAFTPIDENEKGIEEIITAATTRASIVCVIATRVSGWQYREELIRKLLYRVSRKRLMLGKDGALLPSGTTHLADLSDIPLFILPFDAKKKEDVNSMLTPRPQVTLLVMTPGTRETVYPFQAEIKKAINLLPEKAGGGYVGQWIRMSGGSTDELTAFIRKNPHFLSIRHKIIQKVAGIDLLIAASEKSASLLNAASAIREKFGECCYSFEGESIEEAVGAALLARKESVSIAESCTGGEIAARLTKVAGASRYFNGAAVSYSNQSKEEQLSVPHALIHKKGAVSPEVAAKMAGGVRVLESSDWGLSVTGIAGPTGGTDEKPVGLVYIGLSKNKETTTTEHHLYGSRAEIREQAGQIALETLWRRLNENTK
ncbi:MAG: nicotinamide-nucleotide amidohydrolase family protein [Nitrospirota bacterium]